MTAPQSPQPLSIQWRSHAWRPGLFVLALAAALAVYWVLLHNSHTQMREQASTHHQQLAGQAAKALALELNTVVRTLDYFSQHLSWVWQQGNADGFDSAVSTAVHALPPGALAQVAVADPKGKITYSNLAKNSGANPSPPDVYITDREHFKVHANAAQSFLHISEPIKGRISQQWTIQFTRGLWQENQFQGVIVLAVSAEYLATALKAIFPDPTDTASLVNFRGAYLSRSHHLGDILGTTLPSDRPFIRNPEQTSGAYEAVAAVDAVHRLYTWQQTENYPLTILVGLGTEKAMALTDETIRHSHWQSGFGSALLLLSGLAMAWLWTQRSVRARQLEHVAEALSASEARLRITLDAVRDGLWSFDHRNGVAHWDQRILNMLGYGPEYRSVSWQTLIKLIHPADLQRIRTEHLPVRNGSVEHVINRELRLRKADGRWLWVLARGAVIEWSEHDTAWRSVGTVSDVSERVAQDNLRNALLDRSAAAILQVSPDRRVVDANAMFASIFLQDGRQPKELDLRDIHIDQAHWEELEQHYRTVRKDGMLRLEYPFMDIDGNVRWFDTHAVLQDPDDPDSNVIWTWVDITGKHEADRALAIETLRLNTLLNCFQGGVLIEDNQDTVVFVNTLWPQLLNLDVPASSLQGIHDSELRTLLGPQVSSWLRSHQPRRSPESRRSHEVITETGTHLEIEHVEIRQDRQYLGSVWLVRDITRRKLHELELARLASTDTLTALPNRRSFMHSLNNLHKEARSNPRAIGVVMILDIDRFKRVNDTYGHAIGDIVLQDIAREMKDALRGGDVPGRLGGEEFAILLPYTSLQDGVQIAERIRKRIEQSVIDAAGHQIQITISIGVTTAGADYSPDEVLRQADEALYTAKESGRNRVCTWQDSTPKP